MEHINCISLFSLVIALLSACSPIYYSPNTHNVPLISEKGETSLTLSYGSNAEVFSSDDLLEFQGAYGITQNIAIKANGGFSLISDDEDGDGASAQGIEVGVGYFKPIKENIIFEIYGILAIGSFESHFPSTQVVHPMTKGDISANVIRGGVQSIIGYKSKGFSIAASSRVVNLSYNNIKGDLIYADVDQTDYLKDNTSSFLVEPAIVIRGGFEKIKLQIEGGYSFNLSNNNFRQSHGYLAIGLNYNFNLLNYINQTKKKNN